MIKKKDAKKNLKSDKNVKNDTEIIGIDNMESKGYQRLSMQGIDPVDALKAFMEVPPEQLKKKKKQND